MTRRPPSARRFACCVACASRKSWLTAARGQAHHPTRAPVALLHRAGGAALSGQRGHGQRRAPRDVLVRAGAVSAPLRHPLFARPSSNSRRRRWPPSSPSPTRGRLRRRRTPSRARPPPRRTPRGRPRRTPRGSTATGMGTAMSPLLARGSLFRRARGARRERVAARARSRLRGAGAGHPQRARRRGDRLAQRVAAGDDPGLLMEPQAGVRGVLGRGPARGHAGVAVGDVPALDAVR